MHPHTGEPIKSTFGHWMFSSMKILAKFKFLRGTLFDPFGKTKERKMERQLIQDYEKTIDVFEEKIKECITTTDGKSYDLNLIDWFKSLIDLKIGNIHRTNTFWCSALIAYVYAHLGFLNKDIDWTLIEPKKFSYFENGKLSLTNSGNNFLID